MDLYFAPLACSMATRIAFYEANAPARFIHVRTKAGKVEDGTDFVAINPLGQVPVLRTDDGELLTENGAILQYVAEHLPGAALAPSGGMARARLQEWLSFIGTELHKATYVVLLDPKAPDATKAAARDKLAVRLAVLDKHLTGRDYLLDRFSVADAYLTTVLNWSVPTRVSLADYPALKAYHQRMLSRPSIARAVAEERTLFFVERPTVTMPEFDQA